MASINVDKDTKAEFDELQPEDSTQAEFMAELIAAKKRDDGQVVDPEKIADEVVERVTHKTASEIELAAHRGIKSGLEQ
jgi:hypothetical protein